MKTKALTLWIATLLLWLMSTSTALADGPGPIRIGINSQQYGPSRARVAADIHESSARAGEARDRGNSPGGAQAVVVTVRTRRAVSNLPPPFPPLSTSASILHDQHPGGPGS